MTRGKFLLKKNMLCPLTGLDIMPRQFSELKKIDSQGLQYFLDYKTEVFFHSKQTQKSRSILENGSRSLGLFWEGYNSCYSIPSWD